MKSEKRAMYSFITLIDWSLIKLLFCILNLSVLWFKIIMIIWTLLIQTVMYCIIMYTNKTIKFTLFFLHKIISWELFKQAYNLFNRIEAIIGCLMKVFGVRSKLCFLFLKSVFVLNIDNDYVNKRLTFIVFISLMMIQFSKANNRINQNYWNVQQKKPTYNSLKNIYER